MMASVDKLIGDSGRPEDGKWEEERERGGGGADGGGRGGGGWDEVGDEEARLTEDERPAEVLTGDVVDDVLCEEVGKAWQEDEDAEEAVKEARADVG